MVSEGGIEILVDAITGLGNVGANARIIGTAINVTAQRLTVATNAKSLAASTDNNGTHFLIVIGLLQ